MPKPPPSLSLFIVFFLTYHSGRHKRTHGREDGGDGSINLSAEEEEEFSGEEQLGSLEEASPSSEAGYVTGSLNAAVDNSNMAPPSTVPTTSFNSLQTLSMPMTLSQPTTINANSMM